MSRLLNRSLQTGALLLAIFSGHVSLGAERVVRAENMTITPGQTNRLYITLESLGDEVALGFTICFDTNYLTFVRAFKGSAVSNSIYGPSFTANTNRAFTNGRVGITISMPITSEPPQPTWDAGSNGIVEILFRAASGTSSATTPVLLCTAPPVVREISDAEGNGLETTFVDATVSIQGACSYSLNTNAASFTDAGGPASVSIITDAGCPWTVANTNSWITIISPTNSTGSAPLDYSVAANPSSLPRSGVFVVAGLNFTVTQQGVACTYGLNTNAAASTDAGGSGSVTLTTVSDCPWAVTNTNSWITIISPTNGNGSTAVDYSVAANLSSVPRSGVFVIAGLNFTVTQQGVVCTYSLNTNAASFADVGGSGSVSLSTVSDCPWTVVNTNAWITITSETNGTEDVLVDYSVAANLSSVPRSGAFTIAGLSFAVTQQGVACTYSLHTNAATFTDAGGSASVSLTTISDCPWTVVNTNLWITIITATNGAASTTVDYSIAANLSSTARSGTFTIAGINFAVTQQGVACTYALNTNAAAFSDAGGSGSIGLTTVSDCPWAIVNTNAWISINSLTNGAGNTTVDYSVATNFSSMPRAGVFTIGGQDLTITQQAVVCTYSLNTNAAWFADAGGSDSVTLMAAASDCPWTVVNTNSWITINSTTNGAGSANVDYSVATNLNTVARSGVLIIGGRDFTVTQEGVPCSYALSLTNRVFSSAVSTGMVSVTAGVGCAWTAVSPNDWISITSNSNGVGNGSFSYSLLANTNDVARTGAVLVAGQALTLAQLSKGGGFTFQSIGAEYSDRVTLILIGGPPGVWELQFSPDLVTWSKLADITNTTGRVDCVVPGAAGSNRFYRAVLP